MISTTASVTRSGTSSKQAAALLAILFGVFIIAGAGFVQAHALHEGTHDTRHAFGLPCH